MEKQEEEGEEEGKLEMSNERCFSRNSYKVTRKISVTMMGLQDLVRFNQ